MNILLATYSYYPYQWGGSEVYVSGLATYLQQQGNKVCVIAGMAPEAYTDHELWFENDYLKAVKYCHDGITIIGVILKHTTTSQIYTRFKPAWIIAWAGVIQKITSDKWDILHMHAHTSLISVAMLDAAQQHSPAIKIIASYHTPLSCVKNTLLSSNRLVACAVYPSTNICTSCVLSGKTNLPFSITRPLVKIMPSIKNENLPTALRIKFLIAQHIRSFKNLDAAIDQWHVFSEQIKQLLIINKINSSKINLLRHGVNNVFLDKILPIAALKKTPVIFLYVGRFAKIKGFHTLLKAWRSLHEIKERQLWIIGEIQNDETAIETEISKAKQRNDITWFGMKTQAAIATIMQQVHCTIIPSEWVEIGPLVFHEAIASGADVIAADIGGCRELATIYASKTTLFKPGDKNQLMKSILNYKFSNTYHLPISETDNFKEVNKSYLSLMNK